jgi:hypothetical protein
MMSGQRTLTIRFVGDSKNMSRAVKDIVSGLDDTESAGKRVAGAMKQLAGDAEASFRDSRDAADRLAAALGPEMVAKIEAGGRSVDSYITELQRMGLTFDDIRTDVDELAAAIRNVDSTRSSIEGLRTPLKDVDGGLREVRDSADQSRSVLANMVGNSVQDMGALGGVAGTAGMALGQFAEYATEGNISLAGLAKVAGPMVGVGVAVAGVSWAIGKLRESSQEAAEAGEAMLAVQEALRDGKFEDAAIKLQQEWGGTIKELEEYGFTTQEVIGHLTGQRDITAELEAKMRSKYRALQDDLGAQEKYDRSTEKLKDNLKLATEAFTDQATAMDAAGEQTGDIELQLRKLYNTAGDTAHVVDGDLINSFGRLNPAMDRVEGNAKDLSEDAFPDLTEEIDIAGEAYDKLKGKFDDRAAWDNANEAAADLMETVAGGEATWDEIRQKADAYTLALADVVMAMDNIPEELRTSLITQLDQGKADLVKAQLDGLAKTQTVEFQIMMHAVASAELKQMENRLNRDINGNGVIGRASGGPVWPGGVFAVGDNPDGSWNRTTELFVPNTAGSIMSASDSRAALGGSTNIYITQVVPPVVDKGAVGRELIDAILVAQRQSGPVFATVRS